MTDLNKIEIDVDVHKAIEAERHDFEESPNSILRRLLSLGAENSSRRDTVSGSPWISHGVELPEGTKIWMEYNGTQFQGMISKGAWQVDGCSYRSPSGAAKAIAKTKDGKHPNLDGWKYWHVKRPNDQRWQHLDLLRK